MLPYLITGLSILIAVISHLRLPKDFWKATLISTLGILLISMLSFFVFQSSYLGLQNSRSVSNNPSMLMILIAVLIVFFGVLISIFVGYLLKTIRPVN